MYKESETVELKKTLSLLPECIISLSAMLNKSGQGIVYFGINDEGKVCGVTIGDKTKFDIVQTIQNHLKPLPQIVNVTDQVEDDKNIIAVQVKGTDLPYSAYGKYFIRINDSDILMQASDLQHFFEKKKNNYLTWEQEETTFTIDDVDDDLLMDCIRTANEKGRLNYVYKNAKETLTKLGLLVNDHLNNAGLYLFGKNKPITIKEASFPTDSKSDFGEIKEFKGNIIECINEAMAYIQNFISYKARIIGIQREEKPEIPIAAIREIVVNSLAHCQYSKVGDYNSYIIFKSSVRIYNPGSIFKNIDPKDFASGIIGSKIRNILISQVLFYYGYIDAFGTGFDRVFTLCAKENVEYSYINDEFGFTFIFKRKKDFLSLKSSETKIETTLLSSLDQAILDMISINKYITTGKIAFELNKSSPTITRHLLYLTQSGYLTRVGSRKNGFWERIK